MLAVLKNLGARKAGNKVAPREDKGAMTMDQLSEWYLEQALAFEKSKRVAERDSKKIAWRVAAGAMVLAGVAIAAAGVNMFTHKPNPPVVWMIKENVGEIVQLRALSDGKISLPKATDLYYLKQYIHYRESYDWQTLQDFYNATIELSSAEEGKRYKEFMDPSAANAKSPVNKYKNNYRVIATAGTISWVGDVALVSYEKKFIPLTGPEKPHTEYFQATIAREYEDAPKDDKDRGINVPGFKVTSFTPERDVTKNSAMDNAAAAAEVVQ
ncbi:hypothetical protein RugamoR64_62170 [Duganella rhizosphaerae]|uniref:VirB8/TrbF family protein n=1 Tax=Duganella rhizosphaerae TaxID=2885763 RepID=UPI0030E8EE17